MVDYPIDDDAEPVPMLPLREQVVEAFWDLPIQFRLEFVKNLLLNNGGEKDSRPNNPNLVVAAEVVKEVIEVLKAHPKAAALRSEVTGGRTRPLPANHKAKGPAP